MLADRYELDREIGRGGMSTVWLGRDTVLDRAVALKQIGVGHGGDGVDLDRAAREAHLTARINHQNVVAVFDLVDGDDGQQWLVMEHVDGPSLAAVIADRGALDEATLAPIVAQVAGALAAAHAHGIVHRDVKPSNVLLTSDGVAKLSDFGVARAQADASLTRTGIVTGSPAYLSPEVASGSAATPASDVWSLGASVFHALTGRPPYEVGDTALANNVLGAMYRIVNDEPPTTGGDGPLATLVTAMMQRDPAARPSMTEIEERAAGGSTDQLDLDATQGFIAFAEPTFEPPTTPAPEPTPTTAFQPLAPPVAAAPPAPEPAHRRRTGWIAAVAAGALVAIVLTLGLRNDDATPLATLPTTSGAAQSPTPTPSDATTTPGNGITAGALEGFAADYLTTASNDPDAGFALLTPSYQQESKGIEGYKGFWGKVSDLDVKTVSADPAAMTVSYTYSFAFDGDDDRRTDSVTLRLEQTADGLRIAGAV